MRNLFATACFLTLISASASAAESFTTLDMSYRIAAPRTQVWKCLEANNPGARFDASSLRMTRACLGDQCADPAVEWHGIERGMTFETTLRSFFVSQPLDMEVTLVDPERQLEFKYGERSPARGVQRLSFDERLGPDGEPETEIVHAARYRGKNPVNQWLYPTVHRAVWQPFFANLKAAVESGCGR